ncbi:MAG: hypothetical protein KHZ96_12960 [Coprobacillus sp.]|nr:hypothetical protein [Coprobacillus sp.]
MSFYEPELMYALDSLSEYSDWKNVYNVSGNDVLYCPICLGRVKLWNGQDPNKTYKKQRYFHHIDGACTQESRIHFAYKTWLLDEGSKFKVDETIYEVKTSKKEKTFNTEYGNYRPDIVVETVCGKTFYIEIANTNKKTEDYILKWDELGVDVLELDVNEQLITVSTNTLPTFKLIYSAQTGECYIKQYVRHDYDELITERKIYWKRKDLLEYKIKWEKLDWFWKELQDFYTLKSDLSKLISAFEKLDPEDQRFVCKRLRGKHSAIKKELETHYTDKNDKERIRLKNISKIIREINKEFGMSSLNKRPCLYRSYNFVEFKGKWDYPCFKSICIDKKTLEDVYNYFHDYINNYFNKIAEKEKLEEENKRTEKHKIRKIKSKYDPVLNKFYNLINTSKNNMWNYSYSFFDKTNEYRISLSILGSNTVFYLPTNLDDNENLENEIKTILTNKMRHLILSLTYDDDFLYFKSNVRIMEE